MRVTVWEMGEVGCETAEVRSTAGTDHERMRAVEVEINSGSVSSK